MNTKNSTQRTLLLSNIHNSQVQQVQSFATDFSEADKVIKNAALPISLQKSEAQTAVQTSSITLDKSVSYI